MRSLRGGPRAPVHRERDERSGAAQPKPCVKDAFHVRRGRRPRPSTRRRSARRPRPATSSTSRAAARSCACGCREAARHEPFGSASKLRSLRPRRRRRVLRSHHASLADRGRAAGPPAGARRDALVEAVLPLRRGHLAQGARGASARRGAGRSHPQRRVVPHVQRRRHLDAGQVGVPVVRGLGPGVPHNRARARRLRLRQGAARC